MKTLENILKAGMVVVFVVSVVSDAKASYPVTLEATTPYPPTLANSPFTVVLDGVPNYNVFAGAMTMTQDPLNQSLSPSLPNTFTTLCVDFNGNVNLNTPYTYSAPTPFSGQTGLDPTWGSNPSSSANEYAAIEAAAWIFLHYATYYGAGSTLVQQDEVQLAVWDALYDTTAGSKPAYNSGRFVVTAGLGGGIGTAIQNILASVPSTVNPAIVGYLLKPSPAAQGNPPEVGQEVFAPVPEPSTLLAGALLLLPFGATSLRHLRRSIKTN